MAMLDRAALGRATVLEEDGRARALETVVREHAGPAVLVWLRHFG